MTDRDVEGAADDARDSAVEAVSDALDDATGTSAPKPAKP